MINFKLIDSINPMVYDTNRFDSEILAIGIYKDIDFRIINNHCKHPCAYINVPLINEKPEDDSSGL